MIVAPNNSPRQIHDVVDQINAELARLSVIPARVSKTKLPPVSRQQIINVFDATGGPKLAASDGTAWRELTLGSEIV